LMKSVTMSIKACGFSLLKYIGMMCYDFAGPWGDVAEHQANLWPRQPGMRSGDMAIKYFISHGFAPEQLILGVPAYGREFAQCTGLLQSFNGTGHGSYGESGIYNYRDLVGRAGYVSAWERATNATYIYNNSTQSLITYDDARSVAFKMDYVKRMGLGGAMIWELSGDLPSSRNDSLISVINNWKPSSAISVASPSNRICYTSSKFRNVRNVPGCPTQGHKEDIARAQDPIKNGLVYLSRLIDHCMKVVDEVLHEEGLLDLRLHTRLKSCHDDIIAADNSLFLL